MKSRLLLLKSFAAFAACSVLTVGGVQSQEFKPEKLRREGAERRLKSEKERSEAESRARAAGLPILQQIPDGPLIGLQRYENSKPVYYETYNINAAKTISTDKVLPGGSSGLNLTGAGEVLGIWDGGAVRVTHQELTDAFGVPRVVQKDIPAGLSDHSTHVSGTMIGRGFVSLARGMAPAATLDAYDFFDDTSEMLTAAAGGLRLSNHSYGVTTGWRYNLRNDSKWAWLGDPVVSTTKDYLFGFYSTISQDWDNLVYNAPEYLIVKAAGNDRLEGPASQPVSHWAWTVSGTTYTLSLQTTTRNKDGGTTGFDTIETGATAKNVLTVTAVKDIPNGYSASADVIGAVDANGRTFSGAGPTDDGRIKPDIAANGEDVLSSFASANNVYANDSGTSMAAPGVSGSVALLQQLNISLFANRLWASTVKALLINTADEAGANPGPDYQFGWGLMNTAEAAHVIEKDYAAGGGVYIQELVLNQNGTINIPIVSNGDPLRVTIAWTDPAGTPSAPAVDPPQLKLVNNVDLMVIAPMGGAAYRPWVLNPSTPTAAATTGINTRDNVEQVVRLTPWPGTYTANISHSGSLTGGAQAVSVVISADTEQEAWIQRQDGPVAGSVDGAAAIACDASGNCYVGGFTTGATTGRDYYLVKYDPNGTKLWEATYVGAGLNVADNVTAIAVSGGFVYVTGSSADNYATIKYDASTGLPSSTWSDVGSGVGVRRGTLSGGARALAVDASGNVYVTGTATAGATFSDYVTIKYSSAGATLWTSTYVGVGGAFHDVANAIGIDGAGNVIVTGASNHSAGNAYATVKYNGTTGAQMWAKRYTANGDYNAARALAIDSLNNVFVTGDGMDSGDPTDYLTIKYSSSGSQSWVKRYNQMAFDWTDNALDVAVDASGNVYVAGSVANSTVSLLKYTNAGALSTTWPTDGIHGVGVRVVDNIIPFPDPPIGPNSLAVDANGDVYMLTRSSAGKYLVSKFAGSNGAPLWAEHSADVGTPSGICVDGNNNIFVTGTSSSDLLTIKYDAH